MFQIKLRVNYKTPDKLILRNSRVTKRFKYGGFSPEIPDGGNGSFSARRLLARSTSIRCKGGQNVVAIQQLAPPDAFERRFGTSFTISDEVFFSAKKNGKKPVAYSFIDLSQTSFCSDNSPSLRALFTCSTQSSSATDGIRPAWT